MISKNSQIIDRQNELGGTVNLAKKPPLKERMSWIADYYKVEFEKLGVEVKLGVEATAESIDCWCRCYRT